MMKKFKSKVLISMLLVMALTFTACGEKEKKGGEAEPTAPAATETPVSEEAKQPTDTPVADGFAEAEVIDLGAYLADDSLWEDDGGDYNIKDNALIFNNAYYGDFCAVRLTEQVQNVTAKFTLQFTDIAKDLTEDAGTWWDSEFLCLLRSNFAGSAFVEGIDGQAGYCISSWGDMSKFAVGRSGYDDFLGTYEWPLADGKPHKVEFTAVNNADNTQVKLTVVVDGVQIVSVIDDGTQIKKERPNLYPNAGGITLRCKYLGAIITGFDAATTAAGTTEQVDSANKEIVFGDYLSDASKWENDGGDLSISTDGVVFNTAESGKAAAVRLTEESQNSTTKFTLQFTDLAEVSMDAGNWWDSEFLGLFRSSLADVGYTDGQTGYTIISWGDMSTFFLGRSGYDDAFGEFSWPMADGQPHDFEVTLQNNEDNTQVTFTVKIDGKEVASVVDDGSLVKEGRTALYPDAGGVTFRCAYLGATVK